MFSIKQTNNMCPLQNFKKKQKKHTHILEVINGCNDMTNALPWITLLPLQFPPFLIAIRQIV
jgi:hypothetical protein